MKQKNILFRLNKSFPVVVLLFVFCIQFLFQTVVFDHNFKNIAFDSSSKVIEKGIFQEVRETPDGNIIQRFFTGLKEIPYVDYLTVISKDGIKHFLPIRSETRFFENVKANLLKDFVFNKETLFPPKNHSIKVFEACFFFILCWFIVIFVNKRRGFLLFANLSRLRWLEYRHLRL